MPPKSITELKQILGLVNYIWKFLPNLSKSIKPMTDLVRSEVAWIWGPAQEQAFREVKEMVLSSPVLANHSQLTCIVISK